MEGQVGLDLGLGVGRRGTGRRAYGQDLLEESEMMATEGRARSAGRGRREGRRDTLYVPVLFGWPIWVRRLAHFVPKIRRRMARGKDVFNNPGDWEAAMAGLGVLGVFTVVVVVGILCVYRWCVISSSTIRGEKPLSSKRLHVE